MSDQRIILANGSRLLREMLNRILHKSDHLKVVKEIVDHDTLPAALEGQDAEWIIMSLSEGTQIPAWADAYMKKHPFMRIMAFATDGSWIKLKWIESREKDLSDLSLKELIHILETTQPDVQDQST